MWSCPASCIDQFHSDPGGDLILSVNRPVAIGDDWKAEYPVMLDPESGYQYLKMQILLEKTIGADLTRVMPRCPPAGSHEYMVTCFKRYSTGMKSLFMSPREMNYHLYVNT